MDLPDTNPKTRFGVAKPGISAIPPVALLHCGAGMQNGVEKYGLFNWREHEVSASVYYNAAMRHFFAWYEGEKCAQDSGVHHLGHVMACCAILLDAEEQGMLNDDRTPFGADFQVIVDRMTRPMEPVPAPAAAELDVEGFLGEPQTESPRQAVAAEEVSYAQLVRLAGAYFNAKKAQGPEVYAHAKRALSAFLADQGADNARQLDAAARTELFVILSEELEPDEVEPMVREQARRAENSDLGRVAFADADDKANRRGKIDAEMEKIESDIELMWGITLSELEGIVGRFLMKSKNPNNLADFNNMRTHLGTYNLGDLSVNSRSRLAVYIEAREAKVILSLHEIDEALRDRGFEFGAA